jgi:FixJ family two-component response regulator
LESLIRSLRFVVIAFESAEEFQRLPGAGASCGLAIDVRIRGMSGFDLQDRLIAQGSRIPILLTADFANKPFEVARKSGRARLPRKAIWRADHDGVEASGPSPALSG